MSKFLNPTALIWVILHLIILCIGFLFLHYDRLQQFVGPALSASLGATFLGTGVVGLFLYLYIITSDTARSQVDALTNAGLTHIYPARSVRIKPEYDRRLENARKQVSVIGYGLGSLRQDFLDTDMQWKPDIRVRLLAVDPERPNGGTSYADLRDAEERRTEGQTRNDVNTLISRVAELNQHRQNPIELRLMTAIPSVNVMIIDDEALWGPYLIAEQSRNSFTCVVRRGGFVFDSLSQHFEALWENHSRDPYAPR